MDALGPGSGAHLANNHYRNDNNQVRSTFFFYLSFKIHVSFINRRVLHTKICHFRVAANI